ncbi:MAG: hypothetical protein ABI284_01115 [Nitrosospira sp.]
MIGIKASIKKALPLAASAAINPRRRYKSEVRLQGDVEMIKTISAFIIACFVAVSSVGVVAGEKTPISDKDRDTMSEQGPTKLNSDPRKSRQKMDDKFRDKVGPAFKKDREIRRAEVPASIGYGQDAG